MNDSKTDQQKLSDEEIRSLVVARLSVLSPDTYVSIGSDGSFSRDELIAQSKPEMRLGRDRRYQLGWLRSEERGCRMMLVTRPDYDPGTKYLSSWGRRY